MGLKSLHPFMNHSLVMAMGLMSCKAIQNGWVIVESSDEMWSTGGGNGKPFQYSCHENPMNNIRQKDTTPDDEPARSDCVQYTTGEGNGNPLQYSCLENSMDGGAWWATGVHGVAKSQT